MKTIWLHRYTLLIASLTAFLFLSGTLVTSHEGGPLYSEAQSHVPFGIATGCLMAGLLVWLWPGKGRSSLLWKIAWFATAAGTVDAIAGALFDQNPRDLRILHAVLAQVFFSSTIAMALMTSQAWQHSPERPEPIEPSGRLRFLAFATPAVILLQIVLGAARGHGAMSLTMHMTVAMLVGLLLVPMVAIIFSIPASELRTAGLALSIAACAQILLGFGMYILQTMHATPEALAVAASVHATLGALTLATTVAIGLLVWRAFTSPARDAEQRPLFRRSGDTAARPDLAVHHGSAAAVR
jgi:hypothetical protein